MTDPSFEHALEKYLEAQRLSRRRFLGRAGSAGLAVTGLSTLLAACGGVEGTAEKAEEQNTEKARRSATRRRRSATGRSPTGRSTWTRSC